MPIRQIENSSVDTLPPLGGIAPLKRVAMYEFATYCC